VTTLGVEVLPDAGGVAAAVATRLLERLEAAQAAGRDPHIVLTGGTIADEIHREVARLAPDASVDWTRVVVWWGDERFVAPDSSDRNAGQARAAMLEALPIPAANIHEMPSTADAPDVAAAAGLHAAELAAHGPDRFEVVMLGIGPDGHVASLFPGFPQVEESERTVVGVTGSPKPPPLRVSFTRPVLDNCRTMWFVASGDGKAEAIATALSPSSRAQVPAGRVTGQDETTWFLDEAAASRLSS
jgi:6-phosphogluconolactonase